MQVWYSYIRMDQCDDVMWVSEIDVDFMDQKSEYRWVAWIGYVGLLEQDQMKLEKHFALE